MSEFAFEARSFSFELRDPLNVDEFVLPKLPEWPQLRVVEVELLFLRRELVSEPCNFVVEPANPLSQLRFLSLTCMSSHAELRLGRLERLRDWRNVKLAFELLGQQHFCRLSVLGHESRPARVLPCLRKHAVLQMISKLPSHLGCGRFAAAEGRHQS
jgi:hypothetical protein